MTLIDTALRQCIELCLFGMDYLYWRIAAYKDAHILMILGAFHGCQVYMNMFAHTICVKTKNQYY